MLERNSKQVQEIYVNSKRIDKIYHQDKLVFDRRIKQETIEGENIQIENACSDYLAKIEVEGNNYQETRSGKNLLNISARSTVTNGLTITVNSNNSITINGTATDTVYYNLNTEGNYFITLEAGQSYTSYLKGCQDKVRMITRLKDSPGTQYLRNNYIEIDVKEMTDTVETFSYLVLGSGVTFNNITIFPMILKGTYTIDEKYEQYGIMPSKEYPSKIIGAGTNVISEENESKKSISITISNNSIDDSLAQNFTIPIQEEMLKDDYFDWKNKQEVHTWKKIDEYNNEEILTEYISSTGELSIGSEVYYKAEETRKPFTEKQREIAEKIKGVKLNEGLNYIYSKDDVKPVLKCIYKKYKE